MKTRKFIVKRDIHKCTATQYITTPLSFQHFCPRTQAATSGYFFYKWNQIWTLGDSNRSFIAHAVRHNYQHLRSIIRRHNVADRTYIGASCIGLMILLFLSEAIVVEYCFWYQTTLTIQCPIKWPLCIME